YDYQFITNKVGLNYRYIGEKLNYTLGQEIRLLVLHPGQDEEDLVCDIRHVNLLDRPAYEAVSYTWRDALGDHTLRRPIRCYGKTIWITANCQAALYCLHRRHRRRSLWVDAVCIDQMNDAERNHQVRLMSTIYSSASQVLVYLAPPSPSSRQSINTLLKNLNDIDDIGQEVQLWPLRHALTHFLALQYWRRVWVRKLL
ncbi:MAG: hypothetical protein EOP49_47810, partial [Sphingobacteriales bacterium]